MAEDSKPEDKPLSFVEIEKALREGEKSAEELDRDLIRVFRLPKELLEMESDWHDR